MSIKDVLFTHLATIPLFMVIAMKRQNVCNLPKYEDMVFHGASLHQFDTLHETKYEIIVVFKVNLS